ncbi:hypothetical protein [Pseudomonas putida]|uniref:hypothetical protein n=1 Tax=Pseudomonas putida TaxID=303 RepID=UPI0023636AF9|nr:hypothetical protein [Pseudomonas putida]MDD2103522.1 hypothetical protein [Pseudomonas putida]
MTIQMASAGTTATGYFNATGNRIEPFKSERVIVERKDNWIEILGSMNLGFPGGRGFNLKINAFTSSGEREFVPGGDIAWVYYTNDEGDFYAGSGKFNANLNNSTKKYQITFKLEFFRYLEIEGYIEVTEKLLINV